MVTLYSVGHQGREAQEADPATHELALGKLYSCIPTVGWPGLSQQGMPFGSSWLLLQSISEPTEYQDLYMATGWGDSLCYRQWGWETSS